MLTQNDNRGYLDEPTRVRVVWTQILMYYISLRLSMRPKRGGEYSKVAVIEMCRLFSCSRYLDAQIKTSCILYWQDTIQPNECTYLYVFRHSSCPKSRCYNYSFPLIYKARNINQRQFSFVYSALEAEELLIDHKKPELANNRSEEILNYIFWNRKRERIKRIGDKCRL